MVSLGHYEEGKMRTLTLFEARERAKSQGQIYQDMGDFYHEWFDHRALPAYRMAGRRFTLATKLENRIRIRLEKLP